MKIIGVNQEVRDDYNRHLEEEEEKRNSKKVECTNCGAILRYDPWRDMKEQYIQVNFEEDETLYYYVVCPHCKEKVITKDLRNK